MLRRHITFVLDTQCALLQFSSSLFLLLFNDLQKSYFLNGGTEKSEPTLRLLIKSYTTV
jgi:hypothetical protein